MRRYLDRKQGKYRDVFLIGPIAIKIARSSRTTAGQRCNREERRLYSQTRDPILCPVVFSDPWGFFVVMMRAEPLPLGQPLSVRIEQVSKLNQFKQNFAPNLDDEGNANSGLLNGRFVLFDYAGMPPEAAG